jgi:hypothetical protein
MNKYNIVCDRCAETSDDCSQIYTEENEISKIICRECLNDWYATEKRWFNNWFYKRSEHGEIDEGNL